MLWCGGSPGAGAGAASCLTHASPCVLALQIGGTQTINANVLKVAVGVIKESRQLRLQPFNEYRKRFGMKPYESFQELTGRAGMLPQELSGLRWGSADTLHSQRGTRPRAAPCCGACPCLVVTSHQGRRGWCLGCRGSLLCGAGRVVQRAVPGLGAGLAAAWVTGAATFPLLTARPVLAGVIPLLNHSDLHLVQERKRRRQSWKSCMETLMLWSFIRACCLRNPNPMAFLGKAWWRLELHFP